jgi:hypothetical protein
LTNTGNSVDADYLSIDLKQDAGAVATDAFHLEDDRSIVTFTDNFGYAAGVNTTKTNHIAYELADDKLVVTYRVTISRETGNNAAVDLVISTDSLMSQTMFTVDGVSKTMADLFDVKVLIDSDDLNDAVTLAENPADSGIYKVTVDDTAIGDHVIKVYFDGKDAIAEGYTTEDPFNMTEGPANKTASAWQSAIGTKTFALTFEAVSA